MGEDRIAQQHAGNQRRERQQERIERILGTAPQFLRDRGFSLTRHQIMAILGKTLRCFSRRDAVATRPKSVTRLGGGKETDGKQLLVSATAAGTERA